MTSDELVSRLFKPVADHVEIYFRELSEDQLKKEFRPPEKRNHGFETWFRERIRDVLPDLVRSIKGRGPDLILRDETEIELKAASDCYPPWMAGKDTNKVKPDGWQKYLNRPHFAGCLFLGDGLKDESDEEDKIKEIISIAKLHKPAVKLRDYRPFQDSGNKRWVLGLLLRTNWP